MACNPVLPGACLGSMNLLDYFVLQHIQLGELHAELIKASKSSGVQEAKVELNLIPRLMQTDAGQHLPAYQVSARLSCQGGADDQDGPLFKARVGFEAIYQQVSGEAMDIAQFTSSHASLTRQLYPLLQAELRGLLNRLGLERISLPFDLPTRPQVEPGKAVRISGAVH
jgi:hypothetical protein